LRLVPIKVKQAERLILAATVKAEEIGIAVSIVVIDAGGHLKAFSRMDGAWLGSIDVAVRKARTSVLFEMETQAVWTFSKPDGDAHGIETTNDGLVTFAGGIPLRTAHGELLGSIGVSGGEVAQDYAIAQVGLAALAIA
jgi:uncharacterized protein GlcG (DUF336 family)